MTLAARDDEVIVQRRGAAGVIVLNRPKALNSLTLAMVRKTAAALEEWRGDGTITRIVIRGAGERAFCAGGDIRRLYDLGRVGNHDSQLTFWREEYLLVWCIKTYPKPIVALVDGIVMGGGAGLAINAAHVVAGDRFLFAMPEVGIGFFPDVGAAWFLPRLPRRTGFYFALTGLRANAGDALAVGLARTFAASATFEPLARALEDEEPVDATVARFAAPPPPSALMSKSESVEACFSLSTREAILEALRKAQSEGLGFAAPARGAIVEKSPTSQEIALKQMTLGAALDFGQALRTDYRIVSRICRGHDFYEGVRAVIVDRDNRPRWSLPPSAAEIDAYFAPLASGELTFPARDR